MEVSHKAMGYDDFELASASVLCVIQIHVFKEKLGLMYHVRLGCHVPSRLIKELLYKVSDKRQGCACL